MKKSLLLTIAMIAAGFTFLAFTMPNNNADLPPGDELELGFPEDVNQILKTSCFDCHTSEASNTKAKTKLNFSKWNNLKDSKKIGKLDAICEEVTEGKMPTKKYLQHYPETKLNDEQVAIICNWVEKESNKLMGE